MKNVYYVIITLVLAGAAFYGGMQFSQSQAAGGGNQFRQRQGQFAPNGNNNGRFGRGGAIGNFASGEIISKDAQSLTLKMRDGGSRIVFFSPSTKIGKAVDATAQDLTAGTTVTATGTQNSDGSISAQSLQIGGNFLGNPNTNAAPGR